MSVAVQLRYLPIEQVSVFRSHVSLPPSLWLAAEDNEPLPPAVVYRRAPGDFELLAGHAVWQAAQLAGHHTFPATVTDDKTVVPAQEFGYQQDPITEARAMEILKESHQMSDRELAERLHWSRKQVADLRRLLRLDPEVQELVADGRLSPTLAAELVSLPPNRQRVLANQAFNGQWSLRDVREQARRWKKPRRHTAPASLKGQGDTNDSAAERPLDFESSHPDPSIADLERQLRELTGVPVRLLHEADKPGILAFQYHSLDILDGLMARLGWHADA